MSPPDQDKREIPISLRGIEDILHAMNNILVQPSSIRQIKAVTNLSVRVTKNILMQLEKLKQVERIVEADQVLPKWTLTRLGREVANAMDSDHKKGVPEEYNVLLRNISIPKTVENQNIQIGAIHSNILNSLDGIQFNFSKSLGVCFNLEQPIYAETLGNMQKQIRLIKRDFDNFRSNPLSFFKLKKKGDKGKMGSKEQENLIIVILFTNQVIFNQVNQIAESEIELAKCLEPNPCKRLREILTILSGQIRLLKYLIQKRQFIENRDLIFSQEQIKTLKSNSYNHGHLAKLIPTTLSSEKVQEELIEAVSILIPELVDIKKKGGPNVIPLISFCNVLKDRYSLPQASVETIELAINSLSNQGLCAGVIPIVDSENRVYKVIMLETVDQTEDERTLLAASIKLQAFSLSEIVKEISWATEKTEKILRTLTQEGYLRHTNNYLHGDRWYIVS